MKVVAIRKEKNPQEYLAEEGWQYTIASEALDESDS